MKLEKPDTNWFVLAAPGWDPHRHRVRHLMRTNAPMQKLDAHDPRLIPSGPCLEYQFESDEPWQKRRCDAVPGLTGLWQVCGQNTTTLHERIQPDLRYARGVSPRLALTILLRTFGTLVGQVLERRSTFRSAKV